MVHQTVKLCPGCNTLFKAKETAKTCSARCRKRLERANKGLGAEVVAAAQTVETAVKTAEQSVARAVRKTESAVLSELSPAQATQQGFIATPGSSSATPTALPPAFGPSFTPSNSSTSDEEVSLDTNAAPSTPAEEQLLGSQPDNASTIQPEQSLDISPLTSQAAQTNPSPAPAPSFSELFTMPTQSSAPNPSAPFLPGPDKILGSNQNYRQKARPFSLRQALNGLNLLYPATVLLFVIIGLGAVMFILNSLKGQPSSSSLQNQSHVTSNVQQAAVSSSLSTTPQNSTIQINRNTVVGDGSSFTATGQVAIQNEADSTNAFAIQNSKGTNLLVADTSNGTVGIGGAPTGTAALQVSGDITASGKIVSTGGAITLDSTGLRINNVLVCTTNGCISSTNTPVTQPQTINVADVAFLSQNNKFAGSNTFSGTNTFNSAVTFAAQVQAAGGINSTGGYSVNGTAGSSLTCATSEIIQHPTVVGGIIVSGTCVPPGGIPPTFNDIYANSSPPTLTLNSTNGTLIVQDAVTPIGVDLFTVQSNGGGTKYFSVSASGVQVNGYNVCTLSGNCAGVGGDVTTAGGTTNTLAKFTAANGVGNSSITDDGTTVTVGANLSVNTITPTGAMVIGSAVQHLTLQGDGTTSLSSTVSSITNKIVFATPATSNKTITVPNASGTLAVSAAGPIVLDASGNISCPTCLTNGTSGGQTGVTSVNLLTGDISIQGTTNQISVSPSGSTITLATPQDIGTSSSPTFANTNVTGQYQVGGSQIASSNLADSSNIALLNANQTASGNKTYTGTSLYKNTSPTSFQVQSSDGTLSALVVDTTNGKIGIGAAPSSTGSTLQVTGNVNSTSTVNSATGFSVAGTSGSSTTCSGGNVLSNITISGGIIVGGNCAINGGGISPTLQNVYDNSSSPATITTSSSSKGFLLKAGASADSTALFQIQNSSSANLFTVDSADSNIGLGQLTTGTLGAWTTNANNLPGNRIFAATLVANGYLYNLGGSTSACGGAGASQSTVYYAKLNADGSTGTWNTNANALPQALCAPFSAAYNGYVYIMGGNNNGTQQSTVYYAKLNADGSIGTWNTSINSLPVTANGESAATANGYVYVINATVTYYAKLNADGNVGTWATSANALPVSVSDAPVLYYNGYIYTNYGGTTDTVYYAKVNNDGSIGAWATGTSLPVGRQYPSSVITNGYMYVLAGVTTNTVYYAKINSNGVVGSWNLAASTLPSNLSASEAAIYNGYIYVAGGYDGSSYHNTVYYASVNGITRNSGQESISDQLTVGNGLTVAGNTTFQPTADSTSAFSIQNSTGGSLFNIDSINSAITLDGNTSGQLGQWFTNANSLPGTRVYASSVVANGYVYEIGGNGGGINSTVYYAKLNSDGSTSSWNTNTNALPVGREYTASVTANGYVYVIGGYDGVGFSSAITYAKLNADGSTGTWTNNANVLPAGLENATSVVANGYVYVLGGQAAGGAQSTVYYAKLNADGSTGAWSTNTNALPAARRYATSIVANGYVYELGGDNGGAQSTVYYAKLNADGSTGSWSTNTNALPSTQEFATSVTANGYVYVIGGCSSSTCSGSATSTVYYAKLNADGSTGAWSTNTNALPAARTRATSVIANGYVYELGGIDTTTAQSTVYYASTARIQVGANLDLVGLQGGDGTAGGNLAANNITGAGNLQINGSGSFAQGLNVVGGLTLQAGNTDSTSIFSIQNSSGTNLFTVDSSDSNINLGQLTNGALSAWATNSNALPTALYQSASVTASGYVYEIGGFNSSSATVSTVYYAKLNADGSTGSWSTNTNALPKSLARTTSVVANGYLYVLGGYDGSTSYSTVYYAKLNADGSTGTWSTNANNLPQTLAWATSAVADGYIYELGGINGVTSQSTVYYAKLNADGSTGTWNTNANALPNTRFEASSVISNGYIYEIGGQNIFSGGTTQSTVYYAKLNADGSTGSWSTNTNALPQTLNIATSVATNGYMYELGGYNGTSTQSTVYYAKLNADGSTGTWNTNANALPNLRRYATSVLSNGYIYEIGGHDGSSAQSTVYYASAQGMTRNSGQESIADQLTVGNGLTVAGNTTFQPTADSTSAFSIQNSTGGSLFNIDSTNSAITLDGNNSGQLGQWSTNANSLPSGRIRAGTVVANGYVYEIGGLSGSSQSTVYYAKLNADGSTGAWQTNPNALPAVRSFIASVTSNGYLYVIGGYDGTNPQSTVYYAKLNADGSTGTWTTSANALPAALDDVASAVSNGYVYAVGGYDGTNPKSTVYYAKLNADGSTGTWTTSANALPAALRTTVVVSNGYVYAIGGATTTAQSTVYYAKLNADGSTGTWTTNTNALPSATDFVNSVIANGYIYNIGGASGAASTTVYYASTARVQVGANLDLVGSQGGDGSAGGSLAANNITGAGNLQINGSASIANGLNVVGTLSAAGPVAFQNASNSTTAFQVQSSSGANLFTVDSSNSNISLGQLTTGELSAWKTETSSLPASRSQAMSVSANGYVYEIGGNATTVYYAKLNADGSTGTWQTNSNALPASIESGSAVVYNGYVYILGGDISGTVQSTVYYAKLNADGSTGTWQTNSNALPASKTYGMAVSANGYIYQIGGWNGSSQSTVYYAKLNADGSTGIWNTNTNALPSPRFWGTSIVSNGYVYVMGGKDTSTQQSTVYYAALNSNGSIGSWSTTTALPQALYQTSTVVSNGYVYVMGGYSGTKQTTIYYAKLNSNGTVGSWNTSATTIPTGTSDYPNTVTSNGYVLVYGAGGTSVYYSTVQGMTRNSGQESISDQLTVGNGLTVAGNTTFQPTADSTSAFNVQNSTSGYLFNVDSLNSAITLDGNTSGQLSSWATNANALPATRKDGTSVTANGYVYYLGGYNGSSQSTVYYAKLNADGSTGSWTTSSNPLPTTIQDATSVTANGYIYELGGWSTGGAVYYTKLNADGSTGAWQTNSNSLPAHITHASSFVANNYVYVFGGDGSNDGYCANLVSTVYYAKLNADGSTGAWQTASNAMPVAASETTAVTANGYAYIMGGCASAVNVSTVYYTKLNADGSLNSWTTSGNPLPVALSDATSVVSNGYVYVIGGATDNAGASPVSTIYYAKLNADGSVGSWATNSNSLPAARDSSTSVVSNGYVYEIGGYSPYSSTVYYASTARIQVGANLDLIGLQGGDGTAGGNLTANNINGTGNLNVNGSGSFANGLNVIGNTTIQAGKNDSTSVFSIQNSGGSSLMNVDTVNSVLTTDASTINIGNSNNSHVINIGNSGSGAFPANGVIDNFNRVNNASLGSGWAGPIITTDSSAWQISSNQALDNHSGGYTDEYRTDVSAANTEAYLTIESANDYSVWARVQNPNTANVSGYLLDWYGSTTLQLFKVVNGTVTSLNTVTAPAQATGSKLGISVVGSTITAYINTGSGWVQEMRVSDNSVTGVGTIGMEAATINDLVDDFGGGATSGSDQTVIAGSTNGASSLQLQAGAGNINLNSAASTIVKPTVDSSTAFQVQNSSGGSLINVDSTNSVITLDGNTSGQLGQWFTNANSLPAPRNYGASVVANGYVYVLGGQAAGTPQSTVYYAKLNADGSTGAWQTNANALPAIRDGHTSVVANGYVYVIGGEDNLNYQSTVYYAKLNADGSTGAWQTNANALPQNLRLATSVTVNGYVYVIGGYDGTNVKSTVYYAKLNADGSTGAWSTNTNALPQILSEATSVTVNGYVYVIGGSGSGGPLSTVYYAKLNADGSTGAWSTNTNALPQTVDLHTSITANGYVYVFGGVMGGATASTVYYAKLNADGSTGAWSTNTNALPQARNAATSVVANGYVYVIGGNGSGGPFSTVYYASTSRLQIGANLDLVGLQGGTLSDPGDQSAGSTGGSVTAGNGLFVGSFQVQGAVSLSQGVSVGGNLTVNGSALFQNSANSTVAFQVQNTAGNNYIQVDTSGAKLYLGNTGIASTIQVGNSTGAVAQTINIGTNATASSTTTITIGSTVGSSAVTIQSGTGDITLNGHIKTSGASITSTLPSNCGTGAGRVQQGTDSAGLFQINAGTGTPGNCSITINFANTYTVAPSAVLLTPLNSTAPAVNAYVSAVTATSFTVTFANAPAASESDGFYYWVIK